MEDQEFSYVSDGINTSNINNNKTLHHQEGSLKLKNMSDLSTTSSGTSITVDTSGNLNGIAMTGNIPSYQWQQPYGTTNPLTAGPGISYSTYITVDKFDELINYIFSVEEKIKWLEDNGYEPTSENFMVFNTNAKSKLKAMLLAPKMKITAKLPKTEEE